MPTRKFLWITDIHYESIADNVKDDAKELSAEEEKELREIVFPGLYNNLDALAGDPSLTFVGVGGDFTSRGNAEGFRKFKEELLPRLQRLVPTPQAVCMVPGNHDVEWGLNPDQNDYYANKFREFREVVDQSRATSCLFPSGTRGNFTFQKPQFGPIYTDESSQTIVLSVNSAVRCGELDMSLYSQLESAILNPSRVPLGNSLADEFVDFRKHLIRDVSHVIPKQIDALSEALHSKKDEVKKNGKNWSNYLRVALIHHPIILHMDQQIEHRGYQHMIDSPRVLELLYKFDFHVALCGHTHQSYAVAYPLRNGRKLFVVGGLTVGGGDVGGSKRGFRLVTVESDRHRHSVKITNVVNEFGSRRTEEEIRNAEPETLVIRNPIQDIMEAESGNREVECTEIVSSTRVTRDGDALRSLECRDFRVLKNSSAYLREYEIHPSFTSGYIDKAITMKILGDDGGRKVRIVRPRKAENPTSKVLAKFSPPLIVQKPISFQYDWVALNAFAQDSLQFERKYPDKVDPRNLEFTYFTPNIPARYLTLLVQFPEGVTFEPHLSVVEVGSRPDTVRQWSEDSDATNALLEKQSIRYYPAFNAAALRVEAPSTNLSYRIEWQVPEISQLVGREECERMRARFADLLDEKNGLAQIVIKALELSRETVFVGKTNRSEKKWHEELDANIMIFDLKMARRQLKSVAAVLSPRSLPNERSKPLEQLSTNVKFKFGEGVAGRAFKANEIRLWDKQQSQKSQGLEYKPDYYIPTPRSPAHIGLISVPLHHPVEDKLFTEQPDIYTHRQPYGVFNVGTESGTWPIQLLTERTSRFNYQYFQHGLNKTIFAVLETLGPNKPAKKKLNLYNTGGRK